MKRRVAGNLLLSAALLAVTGCAASTPSATPTRSWSDVPPVLPHQGPCAGTQIDIPKKQSDLSVPAPALIPNSPYASFNNLTGLWACDGGGYDATFDSGVTVIAEPGWGAVSGADWDQYVSSNGYGSVVTIRGSLGVEEDPDADHVGLAQSVDHGWLIIVEGNAQLTGPELVDVANSM